MNHDILQIIDYLAKHYQLNQKKLLHFGAIVRNKKYQDLIYQNYYN